MANQYSQLEYLISELKRYGNTKNIMPALKIGADYLPLEQVGVQIAVKKIRFISYYLTSKGIRIRRSTGSESIYFKINGFNFRVSDHRIKNIGDITHEFIVRYDTCVVQVLHKIKMAHFKLDPYYG